MWGVIRQLAGFLRPCGWRFVLFFLTASVELTVLALAPLSFKFMIDEAIDPNNASAFWLILAVLGIGGIVGVGCGFLSDRLLAKMSAIVQRELRLKMFKQIQRLDTRSEAAGHKNEIVSRFTLDLPAIDGAMMSILTIGLQSLAVITISAAILFTLQWSMALIILAGASVIYLAPYLLGGRARAAFADYRKGLDGMAGDVQESLNGRMIIQGFGLQATFIGRFEARLKSLFVSHYHNNKMAASLDRLPITSLLAVNFTIIGFGSYLALNGHISLGALVAFFTIYTSMGNSVYNLTAILPSFASARVSLDRLSALLLEEEDVRGTEVGGSGNSGNGLNREVRAAAYTAGEQLAAASAVAASTVNTEAEARTRYASNVVEPGADCRAGAQRRGFLRSPSIKADQLRYAYNPGKPVIDGISFAIPAGTTAAFVGPSGSGKSTVLLLLLGLLRAQSGSLTMDRERLSCIDEELFRQSIGVVFQDSFLFRGTLLYNLKLGKPDASLDEVIEAARQADIHEFIAQLPHGYETVVEEDGGNFSGGQKQRIALARALIRKPSLLLLDEMTASLDPLAEAAVLKTIRKLAGQQTMVIVSHRLATIAGADQIFVLENGQIVERGRHEELLERNKLYASMWVRQTEGTESRKYVV